MKHVLKQNLTVNFQYEVYFTENIFSVDNPLFMDTLRTYLTPGSVRKLLFVIDEAVHLAHPDLIYQMDVYFSAQVQLLLIAEKIIIPGGEMVKNSPRYFDRIVDAIHRYKVDRHSFVVAIGGGSVLDVAGYAAAVSHRGIKHIRIPTTVLSQDDSGVGIKNGINFFGKKNFLGTFAPPIAIFNDYRFLETLSERHWIAGISEAIKVALIKDALFFSWLRDQVDPVLKHDSAVMKCLIAKSAQLHMDHIANGDPFELGSSRPLDFGHWSAHKIEQLSEFQILHGEAVAIGMALDATYSFLLGYLGEHDCMAILSLLQDYGLPVFHQILRPAGTKARLLEGLEEFREHLGGELTIMLLCKIGVGIEVHEMHHDRILEALALLENLAERRKFSTTVPVQY